jgi:hypothetical protein
MGTLDRLKRIFFRSGCYKAINFEKRSFGAKVDAAGAAAGINTDVEKILKLQNP